MDKEISPSKTKILLVKSGKQNDFVYRLTISTPIASLKLTQLGVFKGLKRSVTSSFTLPPLLYRLFAFK